MAAAAAAYAVVKKNKEDMDVSIVKVFEKYDGDGSGYVDSVELLKALKDLGVEDIEQQHADKLFKRCAKEGDPGLQLDAFEMIVTMIKSIKASETKFSPASMKEYWPLQHKVNSFYEHAACQYSVASLILGNFLANIIEVEIDPGVNGVKLYGPTWEGLDIAFNLLFLVELLLNMYRYGGPRLMFWKEAWNVFDTIIVTVGMLIVILGDAMPGDLKRLKLLRAFRVFRLFKRIESLNRIVTNLIRATPGMLNSLLIMMIVFCVYAVLAVELFHEHGVDHNNPHHGTMVTFIDQPPYNITMDSQTARMVDYGWEYYGTFGRSMYTLFQVMTGDSWSEAVVRPLVFGLYPSNAFTVVFFFVTFILLTNMVLANVVVAALLDEFVASSGEKDVAAEELLAKIFEKLDSPEASLAGAPGAAPAAASAGVLSQRTAKAISSLGSADQKLDEIVKMLAAQKTEIDALKSMILNKEYHA